MEVQVKQPGAFGRISGLVMAPWRGLYWGVRTVFGGSTTDSTTDFDSSPTQLSTSPAGVSKGIEPPFRRMATRHGDHETAGPARDTPDHLLGRLTPLDVADGDGAGLTRDDSSESLSSTLIDISDSPAHYGSASSASYDLELQAPHAWLNGNLVSLVRKDRGHLWWEDALNSLDLTEERLRQGPPPHTQFDWTMETHLKDAQAILKRYPSMQRLRFKLVPSRMKDHTFWKHLFFFVYSWSIQQLSNSHILSSEPSVPPARAFGVAPKTPNGADISGVRSQRIADLEHQLAVAHSEIEQLRVALSEAENKLGASNEPSHTGDCAHTGEWKLEKEAEEFLGLDAELKENFRREKTKRLKEVHSQMAFILDTDDPTEAPGKWTCCSADSYASDGCGT